MKEVFLAGVSIVASFGLVILFILIGWYIVWKLILSRFRFMRELLGETDENRVQLVSDLKNGRSKLKKPTRRD